MTMTLYRLVYYSRNCVQGTAAEVAAEVNAILKSAQRNNAPLGVTGALIFNAGMFAQVLEGDRQDVALTFERIQRDTRHGDVQVLAFEEVPYREFPSWSMAFVGRSREGENLFGHIAEATGFEARRMEGERIFEIMRTIALEEEARAA
ncbi:MAG: BLUF domain-containing protein [Pseudomonadota bacterium]|nr:BLUF domain-containing protein [Pseudomonadota bacterium]